MDMIDRKIINQLQHYFPVLDRPYADAAEKIGITESELLTRLQSLLDNRYLTRFGPLYNAERFGGAISLCAMNVPNEKFDQVAEQVNVFPQVAHNYQREHELNMWFVLATETQAELEQTIRDIENITGLTVKNMPKQKEFYVGLYFEV